MKVLQLFLHFSNDQYTALLEAHETEGDIKQMLSEKLQLAIQKECDELRNDKLERELKEVIL